MEDGVLQEQNTPKPKRKPILILVTEKPEVHQTESLLTSLFWVPYSHQGCTHIYAPHNPECSAVGVLTKVVSGITKWNKVSATET